MKVDDNLFAGEELPRGADLIEEGLALGREIEVGTCAFCRDRGVRSEVEWKRQRMAEGELQWSYNMGLASLKEQVEGIKFIHEFGQRTGNVIDRGLCIPNWLTGVPPRLREMAPKSTSFILGGREDHVKVAEAAPIMPVFDDFHIGSPAAVENTRAAIESGASYTGVLAQYVWELPYVEDDVDTVAENVKAIAMVASKWDDEIVVDSYLDDGMVAEFVDNISMVGYARLERYIVEDLCGARYATGFGQLLTDIPTKISVWLALAEVLRSHNPGLSYLYGNCIDSSDTLINANYGISCAEYMMFGAAERRYRTGVAFLPNPITEKQQVPTVQEIADIHAATHAAAEKARELEDVIDWAPIEKARDVLVREGMQFFHNVLEGLPEFGVDVTDPVQVMLGLKRIGGRRLERMYHPLERDTEAPNTIAAFSATEFTRRSADIIALEVKRIRDAGLAEIVEGEHFLIASSDTHFYGTFVLGGVLRELGAEVIDAGVDRNPEDVVHRLVDAPAGTFVAVSTHNGQCVPYAKRLTQLLRTYEYQRPVFLGGKLNSIFDGESEPRDATSALTELGVVPCQEIADLVIRLRSEPAGV